MARPVVACRRRGQLAGGPSSRSTMHFPTNDVLRSANKASVLIALAWQEMFDRNTPDSHRPSLFDTHFLVAEMAELTTLADRDRRWRRHVKLVQQELQEAASFESHWLDDDRWCSDLLKRLHTSDTPSELSHLASVFTTTAPTPVPTLLHALQRNAAQLPKNKRRTLAVLTHLGTHATRRGYLAEDATEAVRGAAFSNVHAVIDAIGASLQTQRRPFSCIVRLHGLEPTVQSLLASSKVRIASQRDFPRNEAAQAFKVHHDNDGGVPLTMQVCAATHGRAAEEALRQCRRIVAALNFHERSAALRVAPVVLASDACSSRTVDLRTEHSVPARPRPNATSMARGTLPYCCRFFGS